MLHPDFPELHHGLNQGEIAVVQKVLDSGDVLLKWQSKLDGEEKLVQFKQLDLVGMPVWRAGDKVVLSTERPPGHNGLNHDEVRDGLRLIPQSRCSN